MHIPSAQQHLRRQHQQPRVQVHTRSTHSIPAKFITSPIILFISKMESTPSRQSLPHRIGVVACSFFSTAIASVSRALHSTARTQHSVDVDDSVPLAVNVSSVLLNQPERVDVQPAALVACGCKMQCSHRDPELTRRLMKRRHQFHMMTPSKRRERCFIELATLAGPPSRNNEREVITRLVITTRVYMLRTAHSSSSSSLT